MQNLGAPLAPVDAEQIARLSAAPNPDNLKAAELLLARYTLMRVRLSPMAQHSPDRRIGARIG